MDLFASLSIKKFSNFTYKPLNKCKQNKLGFFFIELVRFRRKFFGRRSLSAKIIFSENQMFLFYSFISPSRRRRVHSL